MNGLTVPGKSDTELVQALIAIPGAMIGLALSYVWGARMDREPASTTVTRARARTSLPRPGEQLGGFRLERELGRGGMGVVYLARQLKLDRRVALKVMAAELSGDEGYKARFEREARLAAALDHPHVIPLFETGEAAASCISRCATSTGSTWPRR